LEIFGSEHPGDVKYFEFALNDDDWNMVSQIMTILKRFADAVLHRRNETLPTLSLVPSFVHSWLEGLTKSLRQTRNDWSRRLQEKIKILIERRLYFFQAFTLKGGLTLSLFVTDSRKFLQRHFLLLFVILEQKTLKILMQDKKNNRKCR
jgi:hypothetical protein